MSTGRPQLPIGKWGSISTKRVGKNSWEAQCRVRDLDGVVRQVRVVGTSKQNATVNIHARLEERIPDTGAEINADSKLALLAERWLVEEIEASSKLKSRTKVRYREVVETYLIPRMGQVLVRQANTQLLQGKIDAVKNDVGFATAKLMRTCLSGMLGLAVRYGAIEHNPVQSLRQMTEEREDVVVTLTPEIARTMRQTVRADVVAVRQDLPDVIDMAFATGARIGELLALRWSELNLAATAPTLQITGTIIRQPGEGLVRQEDPKSKSGRRELILPAWAVRTLMERKLAAKSNPHDVIFASTKGTLRDPDNLRGQWKDCRDRHGWSDVDFRAMRKAVATELSQDDNDLDRAASQLGHASTSTTGKYYVPPLPNRAMDSRSILDRFDDAG